VLTKKGSDKLPWRTRKKGTTKQKGQRFFIDNKSHQQRKLALLTIVTQAEKERQREALDDAISEREQEVYALDTGTIKLSKEQLEELEKNKDNLNTPYEIPIEGYIPEGDSFLINQQPSFFDKLKQRILTKPKKEREQKWERKHP
jgi:hypothetical protein